MTLVSATAPELLTNFMKLSQNVTHIAPNSFHYPNIWGLLWYDMDFAMFTHYITHFYMIFLVVPYQNLMTHSLKLNHVML